MPGIPVVKLRAVWDPHRDGTAQHLPYHTVRDHTVCYRTSESSHSLILSGLSSFFSLSLFFLSFLFPSSSSFLFSPPLPNVYDSLLVTMSSSILSSPSRFPSITGVTGNTWYFLNFPSPQLVSQFASRKKKKKFPSPSSEQKKFHHRRKRASCLLFIPLNGNSSGSCAVAWSHWSFFFFLSSLFLSFHSIPFSVYRRVGYRSGNLCSSQSFRNRNSRCRELL